MHHVAVCARHLQVALQLHLRSAPATRDRLSIWGALRDQQKHLGSKHRDRGTILGSGRDSLRLLLSFSLVAFLWSKMHVKLYESETWEV
jgi:hypothetical protein